EAGAKTARNFITSPFAKKCTKNRRGSSPPMWLCISVTSMPSAKSRLRLVGGPIVRFVRGVAAPMVEGVEKHHPRLELLQVIRIQAGGGEPCPEPGPGLRR